jgi:NAD(P)-dependent dehydrogenase (short-subunit alcohol dehydrogenase family)
MSTEHGRKALVTGGAAGIGGAISRRLAADGMHVTFCDIDRECGEALARDIRAVFMPLDVTDGGAVAEFFAAHHGFDILVNNVGVDQHAFFTDTSPQDWRALLAINLETVFAFTHAVLPGMQAKRYGRIVSIASEAGRLGSRGGAVYAAAKAAVVGFTRSIARENARYKITANAVLPGPVRTPLVERGAAVYGEKKIRDLEQLTLLRRLGEPHEIASAVAFLASDSASFITGEALGVSGGMGCGAG